MTVLLRSINTPQCGGSAVFAVSWLWGLFLAMPRVGMEEEEVSAAHKSTGKERVGSRICGCKCELISCSGCSPPTLKLC